jgi:hypothetical protein
MGLSLIPIRADRIGKHRFLWKNDIVKRVTQTERAGLLPEATFADICQAPDGWPVLKSTGTHEPLPLSYFNELLREIRERLD